MFQPRFLVLSLAFLAAIAVPLGCESQVVDAVDPPLENGGSAGSAGSAGSGATGGSEAGTGGSTPSGGVGGSGIACPDGGSEADRDGDGYFDCVDDCPDDPYKNMRGLCGCDLPDTSVDGEPTCADLVAVLAHRYAFNGTGTTVVDTAAGGNADGDVVNATLSGQGTLVLAGLASDEFAGLPNRLLSSAEAGEPETGSITLEAWLRWNGGPGWQRIFDFGDSDAVEGDQGGGGLSYLFLTPRTPTEIGSKLRLTYKPPGASEWEVTLDAEIALPSGVDTHVAVVVDGAQQRMSVFIDGKQQNVLATFRGVGENTAATMTGVYDWSAPVPAGDAGMVQPPPIDLSVVNDINNWLGRSQFIADAELNATYYEFRIYSAPLTPELVNISYRGGPYAVFLQ